MVCEMFEAERPRLIPYAGPFDGFHAIPTTVSKTCLVRFDTNNYSMSASAVGRAVEIQAYADRVELRQDGRVVGERRHVFGRGQTVYDPWHYVPVLTRRPGALPNDAPFEEWVLPVPLERVRRKLAKVTADPIKGNIYFILHRAPTRRVAQSQQRWKLSMRVPSRLLRKSRKDA
jgi:hypothetical protein